MNTIASLTLTRIKELGEIVSSVGIVAGGAVRDLHLGLAPKDYDVFIYKTHFSGVLAKLVELGAILTQDSPLHSDYKYQSQADITDVVNLLYKGYKVQLVEWSPSPLYKKECGAPPPWCRDHSPIVLKFDYTINMMFYNALNGFVLLDEAREAMERCELILNDNNMSYLGNMNSNDDRRVAAGYLYERGKRLSKKLGFKFSQRTIDRILELYPFTSTELLERDL